MDQARGAAMIKYRSTKTYGHDLGLSACFRQHRATHSHCSLLHGYALSFKFTFERKGGGLDDRNWVADFGGLKYLKKWLQDMFDHKTIIARDDPELAVFEMLHNRHLIDLEVMEGVGCEKFAEAALREANQQMMLAGVVCVECECSEHGANSAIAYYNQEPGLF